MRPVIVMDTETCPVKKMDAVLPSNMWTYDMGWSVVDIDGTPLVDRSFIVAEIFLREAERMKSAYYAKKILQYWEDIKSGKRILTSWYNIRKILLADIEEYGIKRVFAHNARFDYGTLNQTHKHITNGKYYYFFPKEIQVCDTLKMSRDVIGKMPTYKKFCAENGYLDKLGRPRHTAEILYRFITKDNDFVESHTALEDVMIEKEILAYCYRQHKKMRVLLYENK